MQTIFAGRTRHMGVNAIREILKVVSQPGMVSLAGGVPSPDSFPLALVRQLTETVLSRYSAAALQYDTTEGFMPLREALSGYVRAQGIGASCDDILVTSGSQGALDALGMVLISKGDFVAVEAPTYVGALQAFRPYEPQFVCVDSDEHGLIPESLETVLRRYPVKFLYVVPNFQNPTGRTIPAQRRQAIARLIQHYDTLLVEDDPYGALRYEGEPVAALKCLAPEQVVYVGTLSKVFAPGLRIGFCVAPKPVRDWLVVAKQGIDLHTSTFNQALAAEYIGGGYLASHLPRIISLYRPRRTAMLDALSRYMSRECQWSRPQGGMFVWLQGPAGSDMESVYHKAVARKVAFVPGKFFYSHAGQGVETMRLNFTMADERRLTGAVATLAEVLGGS